MNGIKKWGHRVRLGENEHYFISLNSSASIEYLSSSERARAHERANHAKNDAQKGCAMQLNGITLTLLRLHPNNINRDKRTEMTEAWMPTIKKYYSRPVQQQNVEETASY